MAKPILYTRRNLLKLFGSLPLASLLPTSSLAENLQALGRQTGRRRLIILELFGGNDALNTLIPYRDPLYRRYRPNLAISPKDWISLSDELAFNPSFKPLGELYQRGELAVIPDAGYPNPSLSHFDSTAIWNTGYVDTAQRSGWAGRTIAANRSWAAPHDANGIVFSGSPAFLQEEGIRALELQDTNVLMSSNDVALRPAVQVPNSATHYIRSLIENHRDISQRVRQKLNRPNPFERLFRSSEYGYLEPVYVQGAQLLWLIACDVDTPVFKLGMPGFDLHGSMNELHRPLLHQVATLLMGLRRGLMDIGTWQDTLILVQSEFGRRPEENASGGTDHGTSGVALLLGGALSGGIYGLPSDLGKLDEAGNPYFTTDFRRIYSSIVTDFWRLPHNPLRNEGFEPLALRLSA